MMLVSAWLAPAVTITLYCKTHTPRIRPDTLGVLSSCYLIASEVQVGPVVRCRSFYNILFSVVQEVAGSYVLTPARPLVL